MIYIFFIVKILERFLKWSDTTLLILNIQLLFYGITYLMILEKNANFNQFKNILQS